MLLFLYQVQHLSLHLSTAWHSCIFECSHYLKALHNMHFGQWLIVFVSLSHLWHIINVASRRIRIFGQLMQLFWLWNLHHHILDDRALFCLQNGYLKSLLYCCFWRHFWNLFYSFFYCRVVLSFFIFLSRFSLNMSVPLPPHSLSFFHLLFNQLLFLLFFLQHVALHFIHLLLNPGDFVCQLLIFDVSERDWLRAFILIWILSGVNVFIFGSHVRRVKIFKAVHAPEGLGGLVELHCL